MTTSPSGETIRYDNGQWHVPAQPRIGCICGDGIGPEIMQAARRVWDVAIARSYGDTRRIHWVELPLGEDAFTQYGIYYPDSTRDALRELRIAIKGPFTTPVGGVRPVRYYPGVPSPMLRPEEVDVVIYRENTEDVYAGIEYAAGSEENRKLADFLRRELGAHFFEGAGLGIKPISEYGSKRLVRMAIEHAITHKRKSVTLVHKGNIMKYTEGAFRTWGYEVARDEYPAETISEKEVDEKHGGVVPDGKIVIKDRIADAMFQQMLLRPAEYDVIAAQVGGIGIAPGANIGEGLAIFEATHGSAPKHAGQNRVNPSSILLSGVMMLEYIGWQEAADIINRAFTAVIADKTVTYDFARLMTGATEVTTSAFADALIAKING